MPFMSFDFILDIPVHAETSSFAQTFVRQKNESIHIIPTAFAKFLYKNIIFPS
jgi:hypothetical protein